jgi:L-asparagine transporter-like permease
MATTTSQAGIPGRRFGDAPRARSQKLGPWRMTLITVGGIMGSGLFLAAGQAVRLAGPGIAVAFLIGVTLMLLEASALAEMSAADPQPGSFLTYARRVLGDGPAFVGGWVFWLSSVLNIGSEGVAGALFTRLWFPGVPVVVFSVGYALLVVGINFLTVKGFSTVESAMSMAKVGMTAAFVVVGLLAVTGLLPHHPGPSPRLWTHAPSFFPHGAKGVAASMVLVLFSMSGTGVLGLAAPDARRPEATIARTIRYTGIIVYVLYLGAALAMTGLVPWSRMPTAQSPFTVAVGRLPWPWAADVVNAIILLAVLSTMNAGLFATDRVLAALGRGGDAPAWVAHRSHGIPRRANAVTGALLVLVSGITYFLPHTAYLYLVTATGFQALLVWILIVLTQIAYRRRLRQGRRPLRFRMPGYPWLSWLTVAALAAAMATAPLAPREPLALAIGLAVTAALWGAWWVRRRQA